MGAKPRLGDTIGVKAVTGCIPGCTICPICAIPNGAGNWIGDTPSGVGAKPNGGHDVEHARPGAIPMLENCGVEAPRGAVAPIDADCIAG